ncbi:unnamed protein product [Brassicogethes aeneus]|uniref:Uncharacterized protein n=1 Tax=Brassicogethes aeneus TaxID=1431903 RepID=A0A9P0FMK9_BRAAE|nr:unnamed protein product [Brassicogethes aeneus]
MYKVSKSTKNRALRKKVDTFLQNLKPSLKQSENQSHSSDTNANDSKNANLRPNTSFKLCSYDIGNIQIETPVAQVQSIQETLQVLGPTFSEPLHNNYLTNNPSSSSNFSLVESKVNTKTKDRRVLVNFSFYIVEFPQEEVNGSCPMAIVSKRSVFKDDEIDYCWWPNFKTDRAREHAVKNHDLVGPENGSMYQIKYKYEIDNYEKAHRKLRQLETTSDVESEIEAKRKPQTQTFRDFVMVSENSSSSDDLPIINLPQNTAASTPLSNIEIITVEANPNPDNLSQRQQKIKQLKKGEPQQSENGQRSSECTNCQDLHKLVTELYRNQVKSNQDINDRLDYITGLLQRETGGPIADLNNKVVNLPINTMEQLQNLEDQLKNENEYKKYMTEPKSYPFFEQVKNNLGIIIPETLKNILMFTGYDNFYALKKLADSDIKAIEQQVRFDLPAVIEENEFQNYYGIYYKNPSAFKISAGHRKILFQISVTMEEKTPKKIRSVEKSIEESSKDKGILVNYEEERATVSNALLSWIKNRSNRWMNFEEALLEKIKINIYLDDNDRLIGKFTCFCDSRTSTYTISKVAKKIGNKKRWLYSNVYKHFNSKHMSPCEEKENNEVKKNVQKNTLFKYIDRNISDSTASTSAGTSNLLHSSNSDEIENGKGEDASIINQQDSSQDSKTSSKINVI